VHELRITVLGTGTRGDVQPLLALAISLQQSGYNVRLVSNLGFASLAHGYDLPFSPIHADIQAALQSDLGRRYLQAGNLLAGLRYFLFQVRQIFLDTMREAWQLCQASDLLVFSLVNPFGYEIAQKLGIPCIQVQPQPFEPTQAFPLPALSLPNLGRPLNRLTYTLFEAATGLLLNPLTRQFRLEIGLTPSGRGSPLRQLHQDKVPALLPFSPSVLLPPTDWPAWVHQTGYWFLLPPPHWTPAPALLDFLARESKPLYIGFGSMPDPNRGSQTELVLDALHQCGQRAVLGGGWGGMVAQDLPETVFLAEDLSFEWLFPHMSALVHHGGAGTTAAGLKAGLPALVIPHFQDQLFWGRRVHALGGGPKPIPRKTLTASKLAESITRMLTDLEMRDKARQVGEKISQEEGLQRALDIILALLKAHG